MKMENLNINRNYSIKFLEVISDKLISLLDHKRTVVSKMANNIGLLQ